MSVGSFWYVIVCARACKPRPIQLVAPTIATGHERRRRSSSARAAAYGQAFRAATPDRAKNVALEDERLHGEKFPRRRACSASGDDSGGEERKLFAAA